MKILWSPVSLRQIKRIAQYYKNRNKSSPRRWAVSVFERVKELELFPESGRLVPEDPKFEIREIVFGSYRIIYEIHGDKILVHAVKRTQQKFKVSELVRARDYFVDDGPPTGLIMD